jgi:intracellular sulfur oxidation DsrE/DsrF family protein
MLRLKHMLPHTLLLLVFALFAPLASAAHTPDYPDIHKLVIQVSTDDERTQSIALNNAVNLQKAYGMDNVKVEIVAYGPGLSLLTQASKQSQRVSSLALQEITFSACGNTMSKMEQKSGKPVQLSKGVQVVPAGVGRILELQEQGYSYIRP